MSTIDLKLEELSTEDLKVVRGGAIVSVDAELKRLGVRYATQLTAEQKDSILSQLTEDQIRNLTPDQAVGLFLR